MLETPRRDVLPRASTEVDIRPARPEDAALLHLWRSERSIRRFQPLAPLSPAQLRSELATRRPEDIWRSRGDRFDWIVLAHRQPAGWITLVVHSWEHGLAECGYSLSTPFQGRGLMQQALRRLLDDLFARTRLHRIEARTATQNVASQKVLDRLGFHREGLLRAYFLLDGEWVDNYLFAVVKEDWPATPPPPRR